MQLASSPRRLVLLAPSGSEPPAFFDSVQTDPWRHEDLRAQMQELRGRVYLKDGALEPRQLTQGRHQLDADERSWHLLSVDQEQKVLGCVRYREYPNETEFSELGVADAALARCPRWGKKLELAVEMELTISRHLDMAFVELGGWALHEELRRTTEALRMTLTAYGLLQSLGGAVAIATATHRNGSCSILKRIGGRRLKHERSELPSYHDPHYRCEMEVLRFYSWAPNPRYRALIDKVTAGLRAIPVVTNCSALRAAAASA